MRSLALPVRWLTPLGLGALLTACGGSAPLTPDMRAFQLQRMQDNAPDVVADDPGLARKADAAFARAREAQDDGDVALRIHEIHLADIYWRTAVARHDSLRLTNDRAVAESALREARAELSSVRADIARFEALGRRSGRRPVRRAPPPPPDPVPVPPPVAEPAPTERLDALAGLLGQLGPVVTADGSVSLSLVGVITEGPADQMPVVEPTIADLLAVMATEYGEFRLEVIAFVAPGRDSTGDLSRSQAVAVAMRTALAERGVDASRVKSVGRGAGEARVDVRFAQPAP